MLFSHKLGEVAMSIKVPTLGRSAVFALAMATSANAADLPVKAPPPAPPPAFSWAGCYLGSYTGGSFQAGDPVFTDRGNANFRAFSGGVTAGRVEDVHSWGVPLDWGYLDGFNIGCNWAPFAASSIVLGLEAEGGFMKMLGSASDPLINPNLGALPFRGAQDVQGFVRVGNWYATATARLGFSLFDRTLVYAKGGAAFMPIKAGVTDLCTTTAAGCGTWQVATLVSDRFTTWTAGGGFEWAVTNNWS